MMKKYLKKVFAIAVFAAAAFAMMPLTTSPKAPPKSVPRERLSTEGAPVTVPFRIGKTSQRSNPMTVR